MTIIIMIITNDPIMFLLTAKAEDKSHGISIIAFSCRRSWVFFSYVSTRIDRIRNANYMQQGFRKQQQTMVYHTAMPLFFSS